MNANKFISLLSGLKSECLPDYYAEEIEVFEFEGRYNEYVINADIKVYSNHSNCYGGSDNYGNYELITDSEVVEIDIQNLEVWKDGEDLIELTEVQNSELLNEIASFYNI